MNICYNKYQSNPALNVVYNERWIIGWAVGHMHEK